MGTFLTASASAALGDYVSGLLQALAALAAVAAFAFVVLRFSSLRASLGPRGKLLSIEDRLRLDPRSNLLIVRVEQRRLLIATHAGGPARLVAELSPAQPAPEAVAQPELSEPARTLSIPQPASAQRATPGAASES